MATEQIIAARTLNATRRLLEAKANLKKLLDIDHVDGPVTNKDAKVAQAQALENTAALIEAALPLIAQLKYPPADPAEDGTPEETDESKPKPGRTKK